MDRLRQEFEAMGFDDVSTYIASGNVIFSAADRAPELEARIESHLGGALGFDVLTYVRTKAEVAKVAAVEPFADRRPGDTHMVAFLRRRPTPAQRKAVEDLSGGSDRLLVVGRDLHWLIRGGFSDSGIKAKVLTDALGGDPGTTRNTTMLRKLAERI